MPPQVAEMTKYMRMYSKGGGRFTVMLMNINGMGSMSGMPGGGAAAASGAVGEFTLTVVEYKPG